MKLKHPLDWYNENTPSEDEEYEKGCLSIALIVVIIFIAFLNYTSITMKTASAYFTMMVILLNLHSLVNLHFWNQPTRCCAGVLKKDILKLISYESKNKSNWRNCRG